MTVFSLEFSIPVDELGDKEKNYDLAASAEECAVLAKRFDIPAVKSITASTMIEDQGASHGIVLKGRVAAELVRTCVTSLKEMPESVTTDFELILVSEETANRMDADEAYLDPDVPEYDALDGDKVPVGEVIIQTVSMAMEPYPRADGATLDAGNNTNIELNAPEDEKPNPFAALDKLRDKS